MSSKEIMHYQDCILRVFCLLMSVTHTFETVDVNSHVQCLICDFQLLGFDRLKFGIAFYKTSLFQKVIDFVELESSFI